MSILALVLPHFLYCMYKDLRYSEQIYAQNFGDNALNPLVCNHSECLAIVVYVCMCVLSVEIEAVVF